MTTPSDSQPASVEVTELWCLHVLGPDEVFPAPDRATAQRWATQWTVWNQNRNPAPDALEPVMSWVVALWPHDAESHAAGLAASVRGNTFPVDPPRAVRCCYGHTAFFAGCEDCPYVRWPVQKGEPITEYEADDISHLEGLASYLDSYARDKRRERLSASADLFEQIARHLRTYDTTRLASLAPARCDRPEWLHPDTAAKDGTILELVVDYTDGHGALQDALIAPTIGWNDLANTGEDKWHIVGWDWCQDYIRDGAGLIRAWRPSRLNGCDDALGTLPTIDGEQA